ncbi:hypothetical protein H4R35_001456 [Dimargaris xerosporica]|nr:hypothetical protein H4R35_001456 [Dimargaris xerosporica]
MTTIEDVLTPIGDPCLCKEVAEFVKANPDAQPLITRLIAYFATRTATPPLKRSREPDAPANAPSATELDTPSYCLHSLAFSQPRKKFDCLLTDTHLVLVACKPDAASFGVEASYLLSDIVRIIMVPTPEKPKPHWTVVIMLQLPASTELATLVFGFVAAAPDIAITGSKGAEDATLATLSNCDRVARVFRQHLPSTPLIMANNLASSSAKTPLKTTTSSTDSTPVRCYWKAREGYLYFLEQGLFFGFKKPILFFPLTDIDDLDVRGITSRTFDLHVRWTPPAPSTPDEKRLKAKDSTCTGTAGELVEFSMLDNTEFDRIMQYIKQQKVAAKSLYSQIDNSSSSQQELSGDTTSDHIATGDRLAGTDADGAAKLASARPIDGNNDDDDDEENDEDFCPNTARDSEGNLLSDGSMDDDALESEEDMELDHGSGNSMLRQLSSSDTSSDHDDEVLSQEDVEEELGDDDEAGDGSDSDGDDTRDEEDEEAEDVDLGSDDSEE